MNERLAFQIHQVVIESFVIQDFEWTFVHMIVDFNNFMNFHFLDHSLPLRHFKTQVQSLSYYLELTSYLILLSDLLILHFYHLTPIFTNLFDVVHITSLNFNHFDLELMDFHFRRRDLIAIIQ